MNPRQTQNLVLRFTCTMLEKGTKVKHISVGRSVGLCVGQLVGSGGLVGESVVGAFTGETVG